jgi:hypothetical protein
MPITSIKRPDLQIPVEAWGKITGSTDKLRWFECVDACIAAGTVDRSFAQLAIRIATNWINKETGLAWRSAKNLAVDIGMSETSVVRLFGEAVSAGLLGIAKQGRRGSGHFTIYRLAMPEVGKPPPMEISKPTKISTDGDFELVETSTGDAGKPPSVTKKTSMGGDEPLKRNKPQRREPQERGSAARSADDDRESAPTNSPTVDAETPSQRAPEVALIATVATQKQPSPERNETELGTAANGADGGRQAQFCDVKRLWPRVRIDEGKAHEVFLRIMAAGHSVQAVIDAVGETLMAPGDVPWLSEALAMIERGQAHRAGRR